MASTKRQAVIGSPNNFWIHTKKTGFDLTHPSAPDAPSIYPRLPLETTTAKVTIDPAKTALVLVDFQNFFLSSVLGRPKDSKGITACQQVAKYAIPACRKAGIRVVYLNWGLTDEDIEQMPPGTRRAFGFDVVEDEEDGDLGDKKLPPKPAFGKDPKMYKGLGSEIGPLQLDDGSKVEGGRLLMRDQWNSELFPILEELRKPEDVWIHKNRMSGLWGDHTLCTKYLEKEGIRTLLFTGVNTDQCVAGSLMDAYSRGYDCLMLSDGCATTSPQSSQDNLEYNAARSYGFLLSCEEFAKGVDNIQKS